MRIYFNDGWMCPECNRCNVLDHDTSCKTSRKRVEYANRLWNQGISDINKQDILENTVWQREKQCRDMFRNLGILNVGSIIKQTMLLKRIIKIGDDTSRLLAEPSQYDKISKYNDVIFTAEEDHSMIEAGLSTILCSEEIDIEQESGLWLFTDLNVCQKEQYGKLVQHYAANYNFMSSSRAHKKANEWRNEMEQILQNPPESHPFTPQEFVSTLYDFICTIYLVFSRNKMFYQAFDLRSYKEIMNTPSDVIRLVDKFDRNPDQITYCTKTEFLVQAKQIFKKHKIKELERNLIFTRINQDIFSLFVGFQKNGVDYVVISHQLARLVYTQLHVVLTKNLFDTETANLGMRLEKNIKEEFNNAGFTYFTNVKDNPKKPTLEIDGIAVKGNQCFVIESKVKGITKMIEEQHTINEIIIDLKGIVDGFENLRRKRQRKRIPSLLKKIEFAKKHLSSVCNITQNNFKIKGMIITTVYPWISEYKGVEIITYDQLSNRIRELET